MKSKAFVAAALATALSVSGANASQPAGFELRIHGYVPVICRATVETVVSTPRRGVVQLGLLKEFCNSANGYEVWVDYSPQLSGSLLMVDGRAVRLAGSHSVRISQSSHAAMQSRDLVLNLQGQRPEGSLSFRVVPL
jgi:hypothetical protein